MLETQSIPATDLKIWCLCDCASFTQLYQQPTRCNNNKFYWASPVHYTTSCKHSPLLLRMGEIIARNMLNWL